MHSINFIDKFKKNLQFPVSVVNLAVKFLNNSLISSRSKCKRPKRAMTNYLLGQMWIFWMKREAHQHGVMLWVS